MEPARSTRSGAGRQPFLLAQEHGRVHQAFELVTATPTSASIIDLRVATNSAHEGWAVWDDNTTRASRTPSADARHVARRSQDDQLDPSQLTCLDRRRFVIPVRQLKSVNGNVTNAVIYINHKKIKTVTGKNITHVTITRLPKKALRREGRDADDQALPDHSTRTYRGCRKGQRSDVKHRAGK